MLRFMRKYATGYFIKALFGLIIIVFIFWGVGSFKERDKTVAEVGGFKVSAEEYRDTYRKTFDFYRNVYKDKFDENMVNSLKLKEKVMDQLVQKYLLLTKAEEARVRVSDREFLEYLSGIETFRRNGKFDKSVYVEVLKRNGMDPKSFEQNERESMTIAKMMRIITDNGVVTGEAAMRESYLKDRGQIKLGYAVLDPADFRDKVTIDDKEVDSIYDKEKAAYRAENQYHLRYLVVDARSAVKDDQAYMDLLKTKDLAAYGKTKGLEVVDLGTMKESEVSTGLAKYKVQEWIKGMNRGDVSLPVRETNRSLIFQLVDKEDGKPLEKSEAAKIIRSRLAGERAKGLARAKAEDALKDGSARYTKDSGFLPKMSRAIPSIGPVPAEHLAVFNLSPEQKAYGSPVEINGKYYLFAFQDQKLPDAAQWEKEKEPYKRYYEAKAREAFVASFADELKKKVKVKVHWSEV